MRGYYIEHDGKIYSASKAETLQILKDIAKGDGTATPTDGMKEVGPVSFSLTKISPADARALFTDIQLA